MNTTKARIDLPCRLARVLYTPDKKAKQIYLPEVGVLDPHTDLCPASAPDTPAPHPLGLARKSTEVGGP